MTTATVQFTPEELVRIQMTAQAEAAANQDKAREELIQAEIRNQTLLAERNTPGRRYG